MKTTTKPRHPSEIAGEIRLRAERIVERFGQCGMPDSLIDDLDDAQMILALLSELDVSLLQLQLTASVKEKT